jgi:hypothetical protein
MPKGPGNNPPSEGWFAMTLQDMQNQITALQTQVKPVTVPATVVTVGPQTLVGTGSLTAPADLATPGPTVKATILNSGMCLVSFSLEISFNGSAAAVWQAMVDIWVDGTAWPAGRFGANDPGGVNAAIVGISTGAGNSVGLFETASATLICGAPPPPPLPVTPLLTPGPHTFEMKYKTNVPAAGVVYFYDRTLTVTPL